MADDRLRIVLEAIDKASGDLKKITQHLKGLDKEYQRVSKEQRVWNRGLADTGKTATATAGKLGSMSPILAKLGASFAGLIAAFGAFRIAQRSVDALFDSLQRGVSLSLEYERNTFKLNQALINQGVTTRGATKDLLKYADALQKTTQFTDDQIVPAMVLLANISRKTGEELKELTALSLDVAVTFDRNLRDAAVLVGKAAVGVTDRMNEIGLTLDRSLTDPSERAAAALNVLRGATNKMATESAKTLAGSLDVLSSVWDTFLRRLGDTVTESEGFQDLVSGMIDLLNRLADDIETGNITRQIDDLARSLQTLAEAGGPIVNIGIGLAGLAAAAAEAGAGILVPDNVPRSFGATKDAVREMLDEMNTAKIEKLQKRLMELQETAKLLEIPEGPVKLNESLPPLQAHLTNLERNQMLRGIVPKRFQMSLAEVNAEIAETIKKLAALGIVVEEAKKLEDIEPADFDFKIPDGANLDSLIRGIKETNAQFKEAAALQAKFGGFLPEKEISRFDLALSLFQSMDMEAVKVANDILTWGPLQDAFNDSLKEAKVFTSDIEGNVFSVGTLTAENVFATEEYVKSLERAQLAAAIQNDVINSVAVTASDLGGSLVDAFTDADASFEEFAKNALKQLARMIIQAAIFRAVMAGLSGGSSELFNVVLGGNSGFLGSSRQSELPVEFEPGRLPTGPDISGGSGTLNLSVNTLGTSDKFIRDVTKAITDQSRLNGVQVEIRN